MQFLPRAILRSTVVLVALCSLAASRAEEPTGVAAIKVPDGFTVELVAAAPLVSHPLMAGFDDRGRLYVADNAGLNLPADELLKQLPNMVRMLEDTDGDGRFDRSTLFADKMTFPQGAVWHRGALYVASPPSIWRLEDTDGDGVADRRDEIVKKFGFIGNAADIHGCFVTPTGRIAWCDGRHGHEFKDQAGQTASKGLAARVFTCRPDGSDIEVFCGGGMDNPVEVAFTGEGDMIGTMTFYNPDDARHDALVHFVYGGVYPRKHPCTGEFKRTGALMPAISRFGVVAPSGLAHLVGDAWGEAYRGNLFSAQFNTHKIVRHQLTRQGATFDSVDEDFLVSADGDFHPTDVLQDADGSLLVIDTGGWFRIGCPTSQIAKPEIGGGIYRIRRTDAAKVADPRGLKIDWAKVSNTRLADILTDPRPAVVERAIEVMAQRGDGSTGALTTPLFDDPDYRARQNTVWALARIGTESALLLLRQAMGDDEPRVRQAAVHAIADLRDAESLQPLMDILAHDEPAVRREAATALGRLRRAEAVPALLAALDQPADRFVDHTVIFALIEINSPQATLAGLTHPKADVRRGALVALDQMDAAPLTRANLAPLLADNDPSVQRVLIEILSRHPEWAADFSARIKSWLADMAPTDDTVATTRGAVIALAARPDVQQAVAEALASSATSKPIRLMLLEVVAGSEPAQAKSWTTAVEKNLASTDADVLRQAIAAAAALDAPAFADRLSRIGADESRPAAVRLAALGAGAKNQPRVSSATFAFLAAQLKDPADLRQRLAAAEAIAGLELDAQQQLAAARLAEHCGSLELPWILRAFEHQPTAASAQALIESLEKSPALAGVPTDRLRALVRGFPSEAQASAERLLARATPVDQDRSAKMQALEAALDGGDAVRGEDVFFGVRAACSACHRIGGRGEKIGPELSKVGEVRNRRDLLEAIVFPSASLSRGYESLNVVTKDGQVHSGLLSRETAAAVFLRTTDRAELRLERSGIDELTPSATSIMPQGLDKILTPRELGDVIAYLQSLK